MKIQARTKALTGITLFTLAMQLAGCGDGSSSSTATPPSTTEKFTSLMPTSHLSETPVLTQAQFDAWFPKANKQAYNVQTLNQAFGKYNVNNNLSPTQAVYNLAAFLANTAHETGDFQYITEIGAYPNITSNNWGTDLNGNFQGNLSACQASYGGGGPSGSNCYYGRGALQLSWAGNYQAYASASGVDVYNSPNLMLGSGAPLFTNNLFFDSGVWFWSDASKPLTPSSARPIDGFLTDVNTYAKTDPLGQSIKVINGPIECQQSPDSAGGKEALDRVSRFNKYLPVLLTQAGLQPIPGYGPGDAAIGQACTATPQTAAFTLKITNAGSTYASVILQAPDYSVYYYVGSGNTSIAPGTTVTVGTTAAGLPNISSGLNSAFPSTATQVAIPHVSIGTYSGQVDVTHTKPTNGWPGTMCKPILDPTFLPNTTASIVINGDAGTCTLTNPS